MADHRMICCRECGEECEPAGGDIPDGYCSTSCAEVMLSPDRGAISPCCGAPVRSNPTGWHCGHCGIPLYPRSPFAD